MNSSARVRRFRSAGPPLCGQRARVSRRELLERRTVSSSIPRTKGETFDRTDIRGYAEAQRRGSRASRSARLDCIDAPANTGPKRGDTRDARGRCSNRLNRAAGRVSSRAVGPRRSPLDCLLPRQNYLASSRSRARNPKVD